MKFIKNFILILLFILPISNSFGAMHTFLQKAAVTDGTNNDPMGVHFNPAGTKMFILSQSSDDFTSSSNSVYSHVSEYNLSTPFDVTTKTYAGDGERCILNNGGNTDKNQFAPVSYMFDLKFSHDGMMLFVGRGNTGNNDNNANEDRLFRFDLTSPYDISTCNFPVDSTVHATSNLDDGDLQDGSNAGNVSVPSKLNRLRGFDFSNDGKRLFILFGGSGSNHYTRLLEYNLSIAYDLSTISIVTDAGIRLQDSGSNATPVGNAKGLDFSPDGKRFWVRTTKNELKLPKTIIKPINIDMTKPQLRLYTEVLNPFIKSLKTTNYKKFSEIRRSIIRLIQISSNPVLVTRRQEEEGRTGPTAYRLGGFVPANH